MGTTNYIGRIGGLAAALGTGFAIVAAGAGTACAQPSNATSAADDGTTATATTRSTGHSTRSAERQSQTTQSGTTPGRRFQTRRAISTGHSPLRSDHHAVPQ